MQWNCILLFIRIKYIHCRDIIDLMSSVPFIDLYTFDNVSIRIDELSLYMYLQMLKKYWFFFLLTRNLISYRTIIRITYILCNIKGSSLLLTKTCIVNLSTKVATWHAIWHTICFYNFFDSNECDNIRISIA